MTIFDITLFWIHIAPSYYWLMYAIGFIWWYLIIKNSKLSSHFKKDTRWEWIDNLLFYIFLWVILWWRFWYILFYDLSHYLDNSIEVLKIWKWWMSFHWWVIWVIIAMILYWKKNKISFYEIADQVTRILPIWLWAGRVWNYLNKELLWYKYDWFLAVEKNWISYFPSPLIEFLLEWIVLYYILNYFYKKKLRHWQLASLFLIFYWIFRIVVEIFFRTPDSQIWYILWFLTMWTILSLPMIIAWIWFYIKLWKSKQQKKI